MMDAGEAGIMYSANGDLVVILAVVVLFVVPMHAVAVVAIVAVGMGCC